MKYFADFIGILGVTVIVITYLLIQMDKLSPRSLLYSIGNLIGSLLLLYSLLYAWNLASVVIQIVWSIISVFGIIKVLRQRKKIIAEESHN